MYNERFLGLDVVAGQLTLCAAVLRSIHVA